MKVGDKVKTTRMTELVTGVAIGEGVVITINDFHSFPCALVQYGEGSHAWFSTHQLEILSLTTPAYMELFV